MRGIYQDRFLRPGESLSELREISGTDFYGEGYDDIDRRLPKIDRIRNATGWEPEYDLPSMLIEIMECYHRKVREGF
jgi:UDP-apiose/xylose synthase